MSEKLSRRSFFGVGAAAAAVPIVGIAAPTVVGLDFGREPAAVVLAQSFPDEWRLFIDAKLHQPGLPVVRFRGINREGG